MAELNMTVKHGQTPDAARANFEKAITAAHAEHGRWIRQVEWSADRKSAILSGPAYQVTLSFDDQNVYVRGNVPLRSNCWRAGCAGLSSRPWQGDRERLPGPTIGFQGESCHEPWCARSWRCSSGR